MTQSPIAAAYDRTPLQHNYQWYRTAISNALIVLTSRAQQGPFPGELNPRGSLPMRSNLGWRTHAEYAVVFLPRATH